jgi:hypothetical protein
MNTISGLFFSKLGGTSFIEFTGNMISLFNNFTLFFIVGEIRFIIIHNSYYNHLNKNNKKSIKVSIDNELHNINFTKLLNLFLLDKQIRKQ